MLLTRHDFIQNLSGGESRLHLHTYQRVVVVSALICISKSFVVGALVSEETHWGANDQPCAVE